jgi:hypothetical protein
VSGRAAEEERVRAWADMVAESIQRTVARNNAGGSSGKMATHSCGEMLRTNEPDADLKALCGTTDALSAVGLYKLNAVDP